MNRIFVVSAFAALTACASQVPAPHPEPPKVPRVERVAPADVAAVRAAISNDKAKLAAYLALPPCAPSGAVACRDDDQAAQAISAEREASAALAKTHSKSSLPAAERRARAFNAAVKHLPTGDALQ